MKKVLTTLCLVGLIGLFTPANAAPPPPPSHKGHAVHAGSHHRQHIRPHHSPHMHSHRGISIYSGHSRHRCWRSNGFNYWSHPWCDCRLGYIDCYNPRCRFHNPFSGVGVTFSF